MKFLLTLILLLSLTILFLLSTSSTSSTSFFTPKNKNDDSLIKYAERISQYIKEVSKPSINGTFYFSPKNTGQDQYDLYSGQCGVIIFHLELYKATKNSKYLKFAQKLGEYLIQNEKVFEKYDTSVYHHGLSGVGFTFLELYKLTNEPKYKQFSTKINSKILDKISNQQKGKLHHFRNGIRWGSAGTGLYLEYLFKQWNITETLDVLIKGTEILIKNAKPSRPDSSGLRWVYQEGYDIELPNYANGATGVAYYFIKLANLASKFGYKYKKQVEMFQETAEKTLLYIQDIANITNQNCLVPYSNVPGDPAVYYLTECNGPSGTGRLFVKLHEMENQNSIIKIKDKKNFGWDLWSKMNANSLQYFSTIYNNTWWINDIWNPYFWDNLSQCDGTSGAIEYFLLLLSKVKMSPSEYNNYQQYVFTLVNNLISRKKVTQSGSIYFHQAENRDQPDKKTDQVGFMSGAAGIGSMLLHVYEFLNGYSNIRIEFPDSPYFF